VFTVGSAKIQNHSIQANNF